MTFEEWLKEYGPQAGYIDEVDFAACWQAAQGAVLEEPPVAVMTYEYRSTNRLHGQTVGAEGDGEYAVLFYGPQDVAFETLRRYADNLDATRVKNLSVVYAEEGYYGNFVKVIKV